MIGRLTDRPTDQLIDWLNDWLTNWLSDRLTNWLTGPPTSGRQAYWRTDWQTDWLTDWLSTNWLTDWLTDWPLTYWLSLTACLIEWLINWLRTFADSMSFFNFFFVRFGVEVSNEAELAKVSFPLHWRVDLIFMDILKYSGELQNFTFNYLSLRVLSSLDVHCKVMENWFFSLERRLHFFTNSLCKAEDLLFKISWSRLVCNFVKS